MPASTPTANRSSMNPMTAQWPMTGIAKLRLNRAPYASMIVSSRTMKPQNVSAWATPGTDHCSSLRCPMTSVAWISTSRPGCSRTAAIRSGAGWPARATRCSHHSRRPASTAAAAVSTSPMTIRRTTRTSSCGACPRRGASGIAGPAPAVGAPAAPLPVQGTPRTVATQRSPADADAPRGAPRRFPRILPVGNLAMPPDKHRGPPGRCSRAARGGAGLGSAPAVLVDRVRRRGDALRLADAGERHGDALRPAPHDAGHRQRDAGVTRMVTGKDCQVGPLVQLGPESWRLLLGPAR